MVRPGRFRSTEGNKQGGKPVKDVPGGCRGEAIEPSSMNTLQNTAIQAVANMILIQVLMS
jgi:hypothetical protein